jgi:hypothetical protein
VDDSRVASRRSAGLGADRDLLVPDNTEDADWHGVPYVSTRAVPYVVASDTVGGASHGSHEHPIAKAYSAPENFDEPLRYSGHVEQPDGSFEFSPVFD